MDVKSKQLKNPQLSIRMGSDAVIDFNERVGVIADSMNNLVERRDFKKVKKNLVYQILLEKCLSDFEKLSIKKQEKLLNEVFKELKFPDYHK